MNRLTNDVYEFIGAREFIRVDESFEHGSKEVTEYSVFLSKGGRTYKLIFDTVYHDCYSGYCGARTSNVSNFILVEEPIGTLHWSVMILGQ